jgi:hypothetical protein
MRELGKSKWRGHSWSSTPCGCVEGLPQTGFQSLQAHAVGAASVAPVPPVPLRRSGPRASRWTVASAVGRISIPAFSHLAPAPLIEKSAASGRAQTTGMQMSNSVEKQTVAGSPSNSAGLPGPALPGRDRLAEEHKPASRQPAADMIAFARGAERTVAPAVGPRAAALGLESNPIPHFSADRGGRVLPTYPRHQGVSA